MTNVHPAMQAALEAAEQALGRTSPNPPVGATIVRDDLIVATGFTQPPGGPHAEIMALQAAGELAHGADLYVTLEPCTIHGRTPPCVDAVIAAGIRRVVIASRDPNPTFERDPATVLRAAGVEVAYDDGARPLAEEQTAPFRRWITTGLPFVTVKYAMTLDGKIATRTGDSRWITGPLARQRVHLWRDQLDAILVGVGTVLADDPLLTTRLADHWRLVRHPLRVILDSRGRMPANAAMLHESTPGHTLIATTAAASAEWRASIRNAEIIELPANEQGRVDLLALLRALGERKLTTLLVEGGGEVVASFLEARLIDVVHVWIAPKIIGGSGAPSPVAGIGIPRMADAFNFMPHRVEMVGDDLLLTARSVIQ